MSWDLKLWTREPVAAGSAPDDARYNMNIHQSAAVEPEDMPAEVMLAVPGITYLTEIYIEPYPDDAQFIERVLRYAKKLSRESGGVLENPQTGLLYTPAGLAKASLPPSVKDAPTISVTWYMDSRFPLNDKLPDFVKLLKEYLPSALPRRYGSYEPPQHKLEQTGLEHFMEFLVKERRPVWYATKPVTYVVLSDAHDNMHDVSDYRCNRIELELLADYYKLDNWNYAVKRLFKKAAVLLDPFYAEIIPSDKSGICSWWWKGLPQEMGYTVIVGDPYTSLWPTVKSMGRISEGLFYTDNGYESVGRLLGCPPRDLMVRRKATAIFKKDEHFFADSYNYAKRFPFERKARRDD